MSTPQENTGRVVGRPSLRPAGLCSEVHFGLVRRRRGCNKCSTQLSSSSAASPQMSVSALPNSTAFVRLGLGLCEPFSQFLADLRANGDYAFFHPHGFDAEAAGHIVSLAETGSDEYWLLIANEVLAYGMLRGWAEGYAVPSLGIAVGPRHRGRGFARAMMCHLHDRASVRGASHVRLKVERCNHAAHKLYESLGYVFQDHSPTELLGMLTLPNTAVPHLHD
jgi:ribosomal protein S18 acetylase RimI-like enzyme